MGSQFTSWCRQNRPEMRVSRPSRCRAHQEKADVCQMGTHARPRKRWTLGPFPLVPHSCFIDRKQRVGQDYESQGNLQGILAWPRVAIRLRAPFKTLHEFTKDLQSSIPHDCKNHAAVASRSIVDAAINNFADYHCSFGIFKCKDVLQSYWPVWRSQDCQEELATWGYQSCGSHWSERRSYLAVLVVASVPAASERRLSADD